MGVALETRRSSCSAQLPRAPPFGTRRAAWGRGLRRACQEGSKQPVRSSGEERGTIMGGNWRRELRDLLLAHNDARRRSEDASKAAIKSRLEYEDAFRRCAKEIIKPALKEFEAELRANGREALIEDFTADASPGALRIRILFPPAVADVTPNVTYSVAPRERKVKVDYAAMRDWGRTGSFEPFELCEITKEVVQSHVMTVLRKMYSAAVPPSSPCPLPWERATVAACQPSM